MHFTQSNKSVMIVMQARIKPPSPNISVLCHTSEGARNQKFRYARVAQLLPQLCHQYPPRCVEQLRALELDIVQRRLMVCQELAELLPLRLKPVYLRVRVSSRG